jgi:hypothetical protein
MNTDKIEVLKTAALLRDAWRLAVRREVQVVCLCAALALWYAAAIRPERARLAEVLRHAAALQSAPAPGLPAGRSAAASELDRFYARFAMQDAFPDALDRLLATASAHALDLDEGAYTVTRENVGRLVRFRIMLPLRGNYPQVRNFLLALAQDAPGIALENAQFERRDVGDPALDVKLQLVLLLVRAP